MAHISSRTGSIQRGLLDNLGQILLCCRELSWALQDAQEHPRLHSGQTKPPGVQALVPKPDCSPTVSEGWNRKTHLMPSQFASGLPRLSFWSPVYACLYCCHTEPKGQSRFSQGTHLRAGQFLRLKIKRKFVTF